MPIEKTLVKTIDVPVYREVEVYEDIEIEVPVEKIIEIPVYIDKQVEVDVI